MRTNRQMNGKKARETNRQMDRKKEGMKYRGQTAVLTCGIYLISVTPIFIYEK